MQGRPWGGESDFKAVQGGAARFQTHAQTITDGRS